MNDLDPAQAASPEDLAECLRHLHLRADKPSFRLLEDRTKHANGSLPGTKIDRVPLRRSTLSDVLQGRTFPRKGFLLTFVEACGVDLDSDQRWEQAWDRLAVQAQDLDHEASLEQLRRQLEETSQQLATAERRAEAAQAQADQAAAAQRAAEAALLQNRREAPAPSADSRPTAGPDGHKSAQPGIGESSRSADRSSEANPLGQPRHIPLLMNLVRAAHSIKAEDDRESVLVALAQAAAATDPDRAERIIFSMSSAYRTARSLARLAPTVAATDPDRGERIARAIDDEGNQAVALARIAEVIAATDPDRADRFAHEAYETAHAIEDEQSGADAEADIVSAVAAVNPGFAEEITNKIDGAHRQSLAMAKLAEAMAGTDPDRAGRLARALGEDDDLTYRHYYHHEKASAKAAALVRIAEVLSATDPDRAAQLADEAEQATRSIHDGATKAAALARISEVIATTDPDRAAWLITDALGAAQANTHGSYRSSALATLAQAVATIDPDYAERIARAIDDEGNRAAALTRIAEVIAATDPNRAERIARAIDDEGNRAAALARIAEVIAATDPSRAEELLSDASDTAYEIEDATRRAFALARIAQTIAASQPRLAAQFADEAEQATRSINDGKTSVLVTLAQSMAAISGVRQLDCPPSSLT